MNIKQLGVSLCLALTLGNTQSIASETPTTQTQSLKRKIGEVVKISGTKRPDLTEYFDSLTKQNTMVGGKVYVKIDNSPSFNNDPSQVSLSSDIVNKAQASIAKSNRTQAAETKNQSSECSCSHCGVIGEQHGNSNCPAHGSYPSCQACGGCLSGGQ
jgi:hypothetical protein